MPFLSTPWKTRLSCRSWTRTPVRRTALEVKEKHLMNGRVPVFSFSIEGVLQSYGTESTNCDLDLAMGSVRSVLDRMVKLAEVEKTIELERVNIIRLMKIKQILGMSASSRSPGIAPAGEGRAGRWRRRRGSSTTRSTSTGRTFWSSRRS
jgi:vacuolar-type H+-ATPase subunit D/Vma8